MPRNEAAFYGTHIPQHRRHDESFHHFMWWASMDRFTNRCAGISDFDGIFCVRYVHWRFQKITWEACIDSDWSLNDDWDYTTFWLCNSMECRCWDWDDLSAATSGSDQDYLWAYCNHLNTTFTRLSLWYRFRWNKVLKRRAAIQAGA